MVRRIVIGITAVLVAFVLVVLARPAEFRIERSATVAAPPETVFGYVNDFHAWSVWSPWEKLDPGMQRTFDGPTAGVGATYAWRGNYEVGEGRMTIERSAAPSVIGIKLEFFKPLAGTNVATFTFVPAPEGTKVTWTMDGKNGFVGKAVSLFMNMDGMLGGYFERGLAQLKVAAETRAKG